MDKMRKALTAYGTRYGISLTEEQIERLCAFGGALLKKNQVMNLTAITEPEQVAIFHFVDCLLLLQQGDFEGKRVIDVGCGGGFPGVPIKIGCPGLELTLLDSLGKRIRWLEETLPGLGISAQCVTARAEEAVRDRREQYDIAVSRAVARLNVLCELCLPYVKPGGFFYAMKGSAGAEEAREAERAMEALGGKLKRLVEYELDGAKRTIAVIQKLRPTPGAYPRPYSKIKQKPL